MKFLKQLFVLALGIVLFSACKKDDEVNTLITTRNVTFQLQTPDKVTVTQYGTLTLTVTELNRNEKIESVFKNLSKGELSLPLPMGSYEVRIASTATYTLNDETVAGEISAFVNKIDVINEASFQVPISVVAKGNDFIIEEIFFVGNQKSNNSAYYGDQYIKLYNKTNKVLYADGLLLASSQFLTVTKREYTPDVMGEAFTAGGIVQIPGNGTQYPIQPGGSIVIAEQALNHPQDQNNPNLIDLSKADFENYYSSMKDVDNPQVTNTLTTFDKVLYTMQGNTAYVIARLPEGMTIEEFLKDYTYENQYDAKIKIMKHTAVKIPNSWVLDAVNMSPKATFEWLVTDTSLDAGYTYVAETTRDPNRFGKSVRRKVLSQNNGIPIFQDTNNSTEDFEILTTPTLKK